MNVKLRVIHNSGSIGDKMQEESEQIICPECGNTYTKGGEHKREHKCRGDKLDKSISEVIGMKVYTDWGEFFGEVEEVFIFEKNQRAVAGYRVKATEDSLLEKALGKGHTGVHVPQHMVVSIGEIMVIKRANVPEVKE